MAEIRIGQQFAQLPPIRIREGTSIIIPKDQRTGTGIGGRKGIGFKAFQFFSPGSYHYRTWKFGKAKQIGIGIRVIGNIVDQNQKCPVLGFFFQPMQSMFQRILLIMQAQCRKCVDHALRQIRPIRNDRQFVHQMLFTAPANQLPEQLGFAHAANTGYQTFFPGSCQIPQVEQL